jgi:hypothetical protein
VRAPEGTNPRCCCSAHAVYSALPSPLLLLSEVKPRCLGRSPAGSTAVNCVTVRLSRRPLAGATPCSCAPSARMVCTVCGSSAPTCGRTGGRRRQAAGEPTVLLNVLSQVAQLCGTRITAEQGGEDCGSFRRAQTERAISVERCSYRARDNRSCEECLQRGLCLGRQGEKCSDHFQQTGFLGPATAFEQ